MAFFKKYNLLNLFYLIYITRLVYLFHNEIYFGYDKNSFQISEFLINYQGGFVRRGLLGELILFLNINLGVNPYNFILLLSISSYLILIVFFSFHFIKNKYSLLILPLVFFLGSPIILDFFVRKDILILLLFIASLTCIKKIKLNYSLIIVNIILILGLLIHESILFIALPIFLLFLRKKISPVKLLLSFTLVFITASMVIFNNGSMNTSELINNSWNNIEFPIDKLSSIGLENAITGLSWGIERGLFYVLESTLTNINNGIYTIILWGICITLVYYVISNIESLIQNKPHKKISHISIIALFQLISISPLFILGSDYGRWIFIWVSSTFIINFLISEETLNNIFPDFLMNFNSKIKNRLNSILPPNKYTVILISLNIGFPLCCSWGIINFIDKSAVYKVLNSVSAIFNNI